MTQAPRILRFSAIGLILIIVGLVAVARIIDLPLAAQPKRGDIIKERALLIEGTIDGAATVTSDTGEIVAKYATGEAVFITTVNRVIARERISENAPSDRPVILRLREGDKLSIFDPATDEEIDLVSFGKDNVAAFRDLLER